MIHYILKVISIVKIDVSLTLKIMRECLKSTLLY